MAISLGRIKSVELFKDPANTLKTQRGGVDRNQVVWLSMEVEENFGKQAKSKQQ